MIKQGLAKLLKTRHQDTLRGWVNKRIIGHMRRDLGQLLLMHFINLTFAKRKQLMLKGDRLVYVIAMVELVESIVHGKFFIFIFYSFTTDREANQK